jgi:hypothetical protein
MRLATICVQLHLEQSELSYIMGLPEFLAEQDKVLGTTVSAQDRALAGNTNRLRAEFRNAVPGALRTLVAAAHQSRDLKLAVTASMELLDRDPDRNFSKQRGGEAVVDIVQNEDALLAAASIADQQMIAGKTADAQAVAATPSAAPQPAIKINVRAPQAAPEIVN